MSLLVRGVIRPIVAVQGINPREDDAKALNTCLYWKIQNANRGLKYVKLDSKALQLLAFTDSSFANKTLSPLFCGNYDMQQI
jgi:hypothetical protein